MGKWDFFKSKNMNDLIGIELADNCVKLVHLQEIAGKYEVRQAKQKIFSENAVDEMANYVHESFKELRIKNRRAFLVASSKLFISKNVDIPSKDKEEIRKIIDLQAGRFTPYSREEIVLDYFCMETPEQHYTNVLLIIMNRKVIDRYHDILAKSGIEIDKIIIASEGMAIAYDNLAGFKSDTDAIAGIHISHDSSDLTIIDRHQMVFVRNIPVGIENFRSNQETAKQLLIDELNKSFTAYKDQGIGRPVKVLFLSGLFQELGFLEPAIKESIPLIALNNVTIQTISTTVNFRLEGKAAEALDTEKEVSFFDLLSCAQSLPLIKIDLVPSEVKLRHQFRESGRDIITFGILTMTIFLMLSVYLVSRIYLKKEQIKKLDSHNQTSVSEARMLENTSTKSRVLRDLIKNRGRGLYVFEKINSMIGEDIYLSNFSYDKDGKLLFSGTAESMSRVFAFVTELEESNYFKDVKTNQTKSRREGQKEVADFEIACVVAEGI